MRTACTRRPALRRRNKVALTSLNFHLDKMSRLDRKQKSNSLIRCDLPDFSVCHLSTPHFLSYFRFNRIGAISTAGMLRSDMLQLGRQPARFSALRREVTPEVAPTVLKKKRTYQRRQALAVRGSLVHGNEALTNCQIAVLATGRKRQKLGREVRI